MPLALLLALRGINRAGSGRQAVLFGVAFGAACHAVGGHYILALISYSPIAVAIFFLDIAYAIPFAVLEAWGAFAVARRTGAPRGVVFALLYTVLEWVRTQGDLSVPSDLLAHAFGTDPSWLSLSPWIGPHGLTLLAFCVALLLNAALERRKAPARAGALAAAALAVWLVPVAVDAATPKTSGSAPTMRIGIVQPSVAVRDKLDRAKWPVLWERLRALTRVAARGADLVLWPESSRPGAILWHDGRPFADPEMEALSREVGVPILYGCEIVRIGPDGPWALYNGAALVRPDGGPADWYGKQQLLPFVEGVPFGRLFGWDPAKAHRKRGKGSVLTLLGNFTPGTRPTVFSVGPARIGVLICYEGLYPYLVRRYRDAGANALAVITNDAWWGHTVFAPWHARMIATRAREIGVPVVRAANSGVSSVTDRFGRMGAHTGLFETTTLQVDLTPATGGPTFYARHGDLIVWAALAALVLILARGVLGRGKSGGRRTEDS